MKFEDLSSIKAGAGNSARLAKTLRADAETIARKRQNLDPDASLVKVLKDLTEYECRPLHKTEALAAAANAFLGDILRVAEMDLLAKARKASIHARVLQAQVDAFLGEPVAPPAEAP